MEVNVVGAATWKDAKAAAMAIAKSPLVKTAFFLAKTRTGDALFAPQVIVVQ